MNDVFKLALQAARLELAHVEEEAQRIAQRKTQLLQTIAGLAPLCGEAPTDSGMRLADAVRTVIGTTATANPETVFSPKIVRNLLRGMGFDLSQYNNHMASIHTVMGRMLQAGELEPVGDVGFGGGYHWKGKTPNPYALEAPPRPRDTK